MVDVHSVLVWQVKERPQVSSDQSGGHYNRLGWVQEDRLSEPHFLFSWIVGKVPQGARLEGSGQWWGKVRADKQGLL